MNFTQMHERLRLECCAGFREARSASPCWPAKPGLGSRIFPISCTIAANFHWRRWTACWRPAPHRRAICCRCSTPTQPAVGEDQGSVPLVSHHAALFEPNIRPAAAQSMLHLPRGLLESVRHRAPAARRAWERFVAVRVPAADALAMEPLVMPKRWRCSTAITTRSSLTAPTAPTCSPSARARTLPCAMWTTSPQAGAAPAQHRLPRRPDRVDEANHPAT